MYEELRRHVVAGVAVAGDHCAVVLLVREGIAAWIDRFSGGVAAAAPVASREQSVGGCRVARSSFSSSEPLAAEELHASVVRVLASMAMSNEGEGRIGR